MQNYDGQEMMIRTTNRGKFQVLPVGYTAHDMTRAVVCDTEAEAEAYITRPMPEWKAAERALAIAQAPHSDAYAAVLASPELREMRRGLQKLYGEAANESDRAAAAQRAAVYGMGRVSCMGRDIGAVRQSEADRQADEANETWSAYWTATVFYRRAKHTAMREAGIPVTLFESPELF